MSHAATLGCDEASHELADEMIGLVERRNGDGRGSP
jgi:hypothetical protein